MVHLDEFFAQIGNFVLKNTDASFSRAQTIIRQHTDKLLQTGDIGFPTTIQPWLNIIKNPGDLKKAKQIIGESEDKFARNLIEISSQWLFPIQMVKFKQFRCLLFLDRHKCYDSVLKTVLYDDASYGQWHQRNDTTYSVRLVEQSHSSLVEHRCILIAKALINLLRVLGFDTQSNEDGCEAKNLVEILVTCGRRDGAKRISRENDMELNNNANANANAKSRTIICGSVINRSGLTADEIIQ